MSAAGAFSFHAAAGRPFHNKTPPFFNEAVSSSLQYIRDYTAHIKDYHTDYFVRGYGAINAGEDRATIAEAAFYENRNEWFAEHPAIKNKLNAMNEALKDTLLFQYSIQAKN